jgi:hypothetical protein
MNTLKAEKSEGREVRPAAEVETKSRGYRAPELRLLGAVDRIQGSIGGPNQDLTNDHYYF